MAHTFGQLDREQHFNEILIQSPYGTQKLIDITFGSAQKVAQKYLSEILQSKFYQSVDVHFGVKFKSQKNHRNQLMKKKGQMLMYKLQAEKRFMQGINKAQNEQQIEKANNLYQQNVNLIVKSYKQADPADCVPCIYIDAKKKFPIYGQIMQDFNRKGMGMLQAKIGYRSVFKIYDKIEFNYESPLTDIKRKYFQSGFTWQTPTKKYGDFYLGINYANNNIYRDIDEACKTITTGFNNEKFRIEIQRNYRKPSIYGNHVGSYLLKNYHLPSTKYSIKLQSKIKNSISYGDIVTGQFSELISQASIPPFSTSKFLKLQYNHRKYFDPFELSKMFSGPTTIKNLLKNSSIQGNLSFSMIANSKDYVSDLIQNIDIRGFQPYKNPTPSYGNLKTSMKFNVHNYPLLGSAKIIPFLYGQLGLSFLKHQPTFLSLQQIKQRYSRKSVNPTLLASSGIGLAYYFSAYTQIQLIYSLFQYQSHRYREPVNFQIRIGVFD